MKSGNESSQTEEASKREFFARNLRLVAAALRQEVELMAHGKKEFNSRLIVIAAALIARGAKDGLLDGIVDHTGHDEDIAILAKLAIPLLSDRPTTSGPVAARDPLITVQEFLEALRATEASKNSNRSCAELTATTVGTPLEYTEPFETAVSLLAAVWNSVATKYPNQLPDEIAHAYLNNSFIANVPTLFALNTSDGLILSKFLCEFIADKSIRAAAGVSEGWLTISDAETLTGINRGVLSRSCETGNIESNGETGSARRIAVASLVKYRSERPKAEDDKQPRDFKGWECTSCGQTYEKPQQCKKCSSYMIKPIANRR